MMDNTSQVGSSVWARRLLEMAGVPPEEPVHLLARLVLPPSSEDQRASLHDEGGTSLLVVRHPFERLLSAFKDKMDADYNETHEDWASFGLAQQLIVKEYREEERPGQRPTFPEFLNYIIGQLSPDPRVMAARSREVNNHWKPFYINCNICKQRYDLILKMETFTRDSFYISKQLGLKFKIKLLASLESRESHSESLKAFSFVTKSTKQALYDIYRRDFELFGYDAEQYFL